MIIVEGPDGAGKTTLIQRLLVDTGLPLGPRASTSENGPVDDLREWVEHDLGTHHLEQKIYDRYPLISDVIYGPLIRGCSPMIENVEWYIATLAKVIWGHSYVIFCVPPWKYVEQNILANHDDSTDHLKGVLQNSLTIYLLYKQMMAQFACNPSARPFFWWWDYTTPNAEDDYQKLLKNLKRGRVF